MKRSRNRCIDMHICHDRTVGTSKKKEYENMCGAVPQHLPASVESIKKTKLYECVGVGGKPQKQQQQRGKQQQQQQQAQDDPQPQRASNLRKA